jgi:hypothetical protein
MDSSAHKLTSGDRPDTAVSALASGQLLLWVSSTDGHIYVTGSDGVDRKLAESSASSLIGLDEGGTGQDLSSEGGDGYFLAQDNSHTISSRALVATDIPSLDTSILSSGSLGLERGGTNTDLSSSQGVLVQSTSGAAVSSLGGSGFLKLTSGAPSVAALARADLPSFMGVTAYLSTSQSVSPGGGVRTLVNLDATLFDTDSGFNTTTHKYTIPVAGYWLLVCSALFFSSNYGFTSFYVDGTTEYYATELNISSGNNSVGSLGILSLSQGQTVDMRVITNSTINIFGGANYTYFSAIWLGV